jgi:hypothetical protein
MGSQFLRRQHGRPPVGSDVLRVRRGVATLRLGRHANRGYANAGA